MLSSGQAVCLCSPGYTGAPDTSGCTDIDECAGRPCPAGAICLNEPGRFSCQCPSNSKGDPYRGGCAKVIPSSGCGDGQPCPDGEQCLIDTYTGNSMCVCRQGYARDRENGICRDVNECTQPRDKPACGLNAICKNLPGSYECQCPNGFNGNPYSSCDGKSYLLKLSRLLVQINLLYYYF